MDDNLYNLLVELLDYFKERYDGAPVEINGPPGMQAEGLFIRDIQEALDKQDEKVTDAKIKAIMDKFVEPANHLFDKFDKLISHLREGR